MTVADNLLLGAYPRRSRPRRAEAAALDDVYDRFPRLAERRAQRAEHAVGRRAPDARARPRADGRRRAC